MALEGRTALEGKLMRYLLALVLLLVCTVTVSAVDNKHFTHNMPNGGYWDFIGTRAEDAGTLYVWGYLDACKVEQTEHMQLIAQCKCSVEDVAKGVTAFYQIDPAYRRIPIALVIKFALQRATGMSRDDIIKKADAMLRTLASTP
jgi:hypothetical protein